MSATTQQPRTSKHLSLHELSVAEGPVTANDLYLLVSSGTEALHGAATRAANVEPPNSSVLAAIGATCMYRFSHGRVGGDERAMLREIIDTCCSESE